MVALVTVALKEANGDIRAYKTPSSILEEAAKCLDFVYTVQNETRAAGWKEGEFTLALNVLNQPYYGSGTGRSIKAAKHAAAL